VWGKPAKEGFLLRLLRKYYSKNSSEISGQNLASPRAQYSPAISALLTIVVWPSIQPVVGCKYG